MVDVVDVVVEKIATCGGYILRRAQLLGQGALHQAHDAVADKGAVGRIVVLWQVAQGQHVVGRFGQVANRVEQRAVQIEDCELRSHYFVRLIFQPMAATKIDIRGLTRLKMQ